MASWWKRLFGARSETGAAAPPPPAPPPRQPAPDPARPLAPEIDTRGILFEGVTDAPSYAPRELEAGDEALLASPVTALNSADLMRVQGAKDFIDAARWDPAGRREIWIESARLAITSKDPETAQHRFELAVDSFRMLRAAKAPAAMLREVGDATRLLIAIYPTESLYRGAQGAIEKAAEYKTAKWSAEILRQAEVLLLAGIDSGKCDRDRLQVMLERIRAAGAELPR